MVKFDIAPTGNSGHDLMMAKAMVHCVMQATNSSAVETDKEIFTFRSRKAAPHS